MSASLTLAHSGDEFRVQARPFGTEAHSTPFPEICVCVGGRGNCLQSNGRSRLPVAELSWLLILELHGWNSKINCRSHSFPLAAGRPTGVLTAAVHVRRSEHLGPLSTESTDLSLRSYTNEV